MANQMDKHYLFELLHKYLEGRATEAERRLIERYYNLFESEPDVLALLAGVQIVTVRLVVLRVQVA